jgi:hypothetical protein
MPLDLVRVHMALKCSIQLCHEKVDHRVVLLELAQHRCELGTLRLNRREKRSIFTAMMFAERRAEATAVQQKITADNRRPSVDQRSSSRPQRRTQSRMRSK